MKKIEKLKKLMDDLPIKRLSELKKLGFERKLTWGKSRYIWINTKLRLVAKYGYICSQDKSLMTSRFMVPHERFLFGKRYVTIQPLCREFCNFDDANAAIRKIRKSCKIAARFWIDDHEDNVMLYRNKPVIIDW